MVYVPKRSRRGRARKPRVRKRGRGLGVKSVKTIARQVISENRERKLKQFTIVNYALSPYNVGDQILGANTVSMVCLSPNNIPGTSPPADLSIQQGVDSDNRIGSRIEMKSGIARLFLSASSQDSVYNQYPQPMVVQVFVGYDRITSNGQPSASLPQFYEVNGASVPPTGTVLDTFRKINKERYVIFNRRTYKIGNAEYFGAGSGAQSTVARQYFTNNDYKFTQRATFDYSKHLIKTVKYSDDGDTTPTTRQVWMWWVITPMTGALTGGGRQITLNMETCVKYTDA